MKRYLLISLTLVLAACSKDEASPPQLTSAARSTYDSSCQTDTIRFRTSGTWTASTDAEWFTLVETEGDGDGAIPVYIQQNDDEQQRQGVVTITTADGQTLQVGLTQNVPDENGLSYVDLPKTFGLGWGYDMSTDIADYQGLRGQVFDAEELKKFRKNILQEETSTFTGLTYETGETHSELQTNMGGRFAGSVDLFIAGASISVQYNNKKTETNDTRYVWCRETKCVKVAYLNNPDYGSYKFIRQCTTSSFRNAVRDWSPEEIVNQFGTHVVARSALGGKLDYYFTMSKSVKTEIETIITDIKVKILFVKKAWTEKDEKRWQEVNQSFTARFKVNGGGDVGKSLNDELEKTANRGIPFEKPYLFDQWNACFDSLPVDENNLTMIDFSVVPIWWIVKPLNATKAKAIETYIKNTVLAKPQ